jgi:hypothetical protein
LTDNYIRALLPAGAAPPEGELTEVIIVGPGSPGAGPGWAEAVLAPAGREP